MQIANITYRMLGMLLVVAGVLSACTDGDEYSRHATDVLCLSAEDCVRGEVCGPSGECVRAPSLLKGVEDLTEEEQQVMTAWKSWGTVGAQHGGDSVEGSHNLCTVEDVKRSDLTGRYSHAYPDGYWGDSPVEAPGAARCGDDMETLAWRLMNCERMSYGLEPVACDQRLVWMGRQHAVDMGTRSFFDHVNPDSRDPFERMDGRGITFEIAGENLARVDSVEAAHIAWMNSEIHRRTLLTPQFAYAGIGVVKAGGQLLLAQEFIHPPEESSLTN